MRKFFKCSLMSIMILAVLVVSFGCTSDKIPADGEEKLVSGFVTSKSMEDDKYYLTVHLAETSIEESSDLKLEVNNKETYDSAVEDEYYLISYIDKGADNLVVKSIEMNSSLGEIITKGVDMGNDNSDDNGIAFATDKLPTDNLTLLDSYIVDIDQDGSDETIALYTSAEKDSKGEIMWDDGQNWLLIVQGKDKDYILFNDYLQLGNIKFHVYTSDDILHINTVETTTAGIKVSDYKFDNGTNRFLIEVPFRTSDNVNLLHSSMGY